MRLKCVRCGAELEEGYRKAHCPDCVAEWVAKQKELAKAKGLEIIDVEHKDFVEEEETTGNGWPNPIIRMKDYMKPEDIDEEGAMRLVEEVFEGTIGNITRAYEAWVREGLADSKPATIYRAEISYNQATRILCSPLFGAISNSDPNDLLEAIWKEVHRKIFMGSARLEALVKKRMRKAREAMTKPKDKKGRG